MVSVFNRGALFRFAAYLALWLILIGSSVANLVVGLMAAACATWLSVVLLPVSYRRISLTALGRLSVRLPLQSLFAGADVARRALDRRMPLKPGFITFATGLEAGPSRSAFRVLLSLQPGTLPVGVGMSGDLLIHCLDMSQPIAVQLAAEEALFAQVTGGGSHPMHNG